MGKKEGGFETKAHELAEKQREISISEFFTKNRHLLGFDNPRKALLMAVKEAVDNSLTYDMPLIVSQNGKISIVKIGEIVDNFIEAKKTAVIKNENLEKMLIDENLEVLAFDKNSLKLSFRKVSTVFRHKVNSKIYRVKLISGRYVDLTAYHSVFTLDKGKVTSIPTTELKEGMSIVVPRKEWNSNSFIKEINLIEELILLDSSLTKKINIYGINSFFTSSIIKQIRDLLPKTKWYRTNDFKKFNYIPLNILRKLKIDLGNFNDSKVGISLCKHKIPAVIKVDHNFVELLGLYVSEGSMLKSLTRIHFSFGSHEKELVYYLADIFEKVFKISPKIKKAHDTAYNVVANSSIICFVFKNILKVGDNAPTKLIPNFVFDFNNSLKHSFLLAYLVGDGYPTKELFYLIKNDLMLDRLSKEKITCATASHELFIGLQYLLSSLGLGYSVGYKEPQKRIINNVLAEFGNNYYIYIYSGNKDCAINFLPIKDTIISSKDSKVSCSISRANQISIHTETLNNTLSTSKIIAYQGVETFLTGDLGVLTIKNIEEINYNHEWVYDVSVPECENFVAGVGAILCHNSLDACEEARILPDIYVELQQLKEDRFKVIVEDNGPGIVKEQIPKIFGKLLYGSKFHRLRCSRGQQGIGISAVLLYGQLTTGKGMYVTSRVSPKHNTNHFEVQIDTQKNEPIVAEGKSVEWNKEHGTRIEVDMQASYQKGKQSVDEYLKEIALINPHAQIVYKTPEKETITYARAINELPVEAKEIKPHPYGVELGVLIRMLHSTESGTLSSFLQNDFSRISQQLATQICDEAKLSPRARPSTIAREEAENLFNVIQKTKIVAPPTDCLNPLKEDALIKGLKKEVNAEFYTAVTRSPSVYRGMPFTIEVGLAYGGDLAKEESVKVMRFANRVPLLYQQGACATSESIIDTAWKNYGVSQSKDSMPFGPVVIVVHMVSVWVPFTSEAKEAIAHYPEIIKDMKLALQEAGRQMSIYIRKTVRAREQQEKINLFEKYIPELVNSLHTLTGEKKEILHEELKKVLNRNMKDLLSEVKEAEKTEIKGKNVAFGEKQQTLGDVDEVEDGS